MILDQRNIKLSQIYFSLVDFEFPNVYLLYLHIFLGGEWDWFIWVWQCHFYINFFGPCATLVSFSKYFQCYIDDKWLSDSLMITLKFLKIIMNHAKIMSGAVL